MLRQTAKAHHHNREDVGGYAQTAVELADELELSPADRAALLPVMAELLAQAQMVYEQSGMVPQGLIEGLRR